MNHALFPIHRETEQGLRRRDHERARESEREQGQDNAGYEQVSGDERQRLCSD
jgi:hypothetical protein